MARPAAAPIAPTSTTLPDMVANLETFRDSLPNSGDKASYKTMADGFLIQLETVRDGMPEGEDPVYSLAFRLVLESMASRLAQVGSALALDRKNAPIHTKCVNAVSVITAAVKRGAQGPQDTKTSADAQPSTKPAAGKAGSAK